MNTNELRQIQVALARSEKLSDAQFAKLAELRRSENAGKKWVEVQKLELREGEEIWDFIDALWTATFTSRVILADGSLDVWLHGIYDKFVIVQDGNTGRFFRAEYSRNDDGTFVFGEPEEVSMQWIPVSSGSDEDAEKVAKRAPARWVEVSKTRGKWSGVVPFSMRR